MIAFFLSMVHKINKIVFIDSNVLEFCTTEKPCAENEGDCDNNIECQSGLKCGQDNCPASLGYDWSIDCCYQPNRK